MFLHTLWAVPLHCTCANSVKHCIFTRHCVLKNCNGQEMELDPPGDAQVYLFLLTNAMGIMCAEQQLTHQENPAEDVLQRQLKKFNLP
ncbi:hypothetical protein L3Q82_021968 [Scortum barcoo]|uniref:Uncharacterized protein n=1 Tax=Scortum barcoo TaxID=214431 RepID=A0ACB8X239_9TELE|nr:hypothetical protein L3Q82_021968 [Scortum barcoo]